MKKPEMFELTLYSMTAQECLDFLKACKAFMYNCEWHIRGDYDERNVQQIFCNFEPEDLQSARIKTEVVASQLGYKPSDLRLSTKRL